MIAAVNQSTNGRPTVEDHEVSVSPETIARYQELDEWRKECDRESRKAKKEMDILESAMSDAVEAAGGDLAAGKDLLYFDWVDGKPSYKSICELHIAPGVLVREVAATPKRRKLVIDRIE